MVSKNRTASTDLFKFKFVRAKRPSDRLMIVLHGRGDSIRPFFEFQDELSLKDMNFLLINAPRRFLRGWSWYAEPPSQRPSVERMRLKMFRLIHDLEKQGWSTENMYFLGFSQGGLVSADVGLHFPKKLGGIIGVSSYFHFFPRWRKNMTEQSRKTPWLFVHGRKDDVLDIKSTRFGVEKLRAAGIRVKWAELDKKHVFCDEDYPIIRKWVESRIRKPAKFKSPRGSV